MAASGPPAWGGSKDVAESATYLAGKHGAFVSSRKRAANSSLSRSNPGSDHNTANRTAYAEDMATRNGAPLAHAIARHFGIKNYRTGNYNGYNISRGGATFRIQILWAVHGHFDHVHLGVRLVGGSYVGKVADPLKGLSHRTRALANKLLYHRRGRWHEAKTGKGRKYREHLRWAGWYKARLVVLWRTTRNKTKKRVLERVLKATDGTL